ncbi:MAG TPA: hypothetical protein VK348_03555 [Planctomycetota bacterium]|nr:hypothetical protein [Planctomycetota bacterium]
MRHTNRHGFSLAELLIAATLLFMMVYGVGTLIVSGSDATEYARRLDRVTEIDQDVLDDLRLELVSSIKLFGSDAEGLATLAKLDLTRAPALQTGSRLPTIDDTGAVRKDVPGNEITGNQLLFAKFAFQDKFTCSTGTTYATDVYRWLYYYLSPEDGGPRPGSPLGLNLVRAASEPLADGDQIDRIVSAAERTEVLRHLAEGTPDANGQSHPPLVVVWKRGQSVLTLGTLRQIDPTLFVLGNNPIAPRPSPWRIVLADAPAGLLSFRHHSVASNYARANMGVARFGLVQTLSDYPHGFEVQIVGPNAGREVLLHLVLASTNRRGQVAWSDMQAVVDARDL